MKPVRHLQDRIAGRPVLVLGKGPSLTADALDAARAGHFVIGINEVASLHRVDAAFCIDIEPLERILDGVAAEGAALILPWRPNKRTHAGGARSRPMRETLVDLAAARPALAAIEAAGQLFYFHTLFAGADGMDNLFRPNLVSLSALLQILASAGTSRISTLGIDGGTGYAQGLDVGPRTQLGQGYSKQFAILKDICMKNGLTMERADGETIPIFVGCEREQLLPARVLEHSIRKWTREKVRIIRLYEVLEPAQTEGRTPFSLQRLSIPRLSGYSGKSIYLDSDMLLFDDVRALVAHHPDNVALSSAAAPPGSGRQPQFSVMVIDCSRARWDADALLVAAQGNYEAIMFDFAFEPSKAVALPYEWNSLERYEPGKTALLHFTDMDRQPWLSNRNPLAGVWVEALLDAVRDGFISFDEIVKEARSGNVRPGLMYQVEHGIVDARALPRVERLKDELYTPPHTVARFSGRNTVLERSVLAVAKKLRSLFREQGTAGQ
jgi:hypothetical protein